VVSQEELQEVRITSDTSTLETCYSNFIARQLYVQKCLKYRKIQYWLTGRLLAVRCNQYIIVGRQEQSIDKVIIGRVKHDNLFDKGVSVE